MNKNIFQNSKITPGMTINEAGGVTHRLSDEEALAQLVVTGTFHNTVYVSGEQQLADVLHLSGNCSPEFIAKLAVYARKHAFMKDTPALLLAHLSTRNTALFKRVFPLIVNNMKMLRNFVKVMRSGAVGRKSLGSAPKKLIQKYLTESNHVDLFKESIGNDPSLADIIKMVHPRPVDDVQKNFFAYTLGSKYSLESLDDLIQDFEAFKKNNTGLNPPDINFQFLSNIKMNQEQWVKVAMNMSWHTLRMNLNTLARNKVLDSPEIVEVLAQKLEDPEAIKYSKVFPFQIFNTLRNIQTNNGRIVRALDAALHHSLKNVPEFSAKTAVFVDVSGSMGAPVLGDVSYTRTSAAVSAREAAALFAAAIKAKNENNATVFAFHTRVEDSVTKEINNAKGVRAIANAINRSPSGGTSCSSTVQFLLSQKMVDFDNIVILSDNESWADGANGTLGKVFKKYCEYNPKAKMVCVDIAPNTTTPSHNKKTLNIGGFSDSIFTTIESFLKDDQNNLLKTIYSVEI